MAPRSKKYLTINTVCSFISAAWLFQTGADEKTLKLISIFMLGLKIFHFITSQTTQWCNILSWFSFQDKTAYVHLFMYRTCEHSHAWVTCIKASTWLKVKGWKCIIISINKMGVLKSTLVSKEGLHVHGDCCRLFIILTSLMWRYIVHLPIHTYCTIY